MSAAELAPVLQKLVVPNNNKELRLLSEGVMEVVTNVQHPLELIPETNPRWPLTHLRVL